MVVLVAVAPAVWRNWAAIRLALGRIYSDFRDYPEMVTFNHSIVEVVRMKRSISASTGGNQGDSRTRGSAVYFISPSRCRMVYGLVDLGEYPESPCRPACPKPPGVSTSSLPNVCISFLLMA
jgi:hypothetical protein